MSPARIHKALPPVIDEALALIASWFRLLADARMANRRKEGLTVICFISHPTIIELCDNVRSNLLRRLSQQVNKLGGA